MTDSSPHDYDKLAHLLKQRLDVISDHELRDTNPDQHLETLISVSKAVDAEYARLKGRIPVRLDHFLSQCSYGKALQFIENLTAPSDRAE